MYKARQVAQMAHPSPRKEPALKFSGPPHKLYEPEQVQRSTEGQGFQIEERVMDMPYVSPRKPYQHDDLKLDVKWADEQEGHDLRDQGRSHRDDQRPRDDDSVDYRGNERGRPRERDHSEKYQWYNERKLSPPLEMRRSRSLSPARGVNGLIKDLDKVQL